MNKGNKLQVERVVEYCEDRYNDNFSVVSTGGDVWSDNFSELILSSENLKGAYVNVRVYSNDDILDNYVAVKYKKDVENAVLPVAQSIYGNALVVNIPVGFGLNHFNEDISFLEYASDDKSCVYIAIATNDSPIYKTEKIEELRKELKRINVCADITVSYYDVDINEIQMVDNNSKVYKHQPIVKGFMYINDEYSVTSLNWSDTK